MKNHRFLFLLLLLGISSSCSDDADEVDICSLSLTSETIGTARCGQADGKIVLATTGESGQVSYQLNDGTEQGSATFESLASGTYTITARDESGCIATTSVAIEETQATLSAVATITPSECDTSVGQIVVDVSGGTAPYTYVLNDSLSSNTPRFQSLPPGTYRIAVRDAKGCATNVKASVTSGTSFKTTIKEMITTTCAVTGCHVAPRTPNFLVDEEIFSYATRIQVRTSEGSMPPPDSGRSLTAEQIDQIACWVNDGAPDN